MHNINDMDGKDHFDFNDGLIIILKFDGGIDDGDQYGYFKLF